MNHMGPVIPAHGGGPGVVWGGLGRVCGRGLGDGDECYGRVENSGGMGIFDKKLGLWWDSVVGERGIKQNNVTRELVGNNVENVIRLIGTWAERLFDPSIQTNL